MKKITVFTFTCIVSFLFFIVEKGLAFIPVPSHVVVLVLENHGYNQVVGSSAAPYINSLIGSSHCALFSNSFALSHPSQGNYLQLFSGSNQGVINDNVPTGLPFTTPNLGAELLNASKTFTGYSEDLPSVGFTGATSANYARKHNPWVNWQGTSVNGIPSSCNQPFSAFPANYNLLPTVSFVIPNLVNDMHNGTDPIRISTCDTWVQNNMDAYIQWAKSNNSLFILTFDEDDGSYAQRILTLFIGADVETGTYANTIDHYSILSLLEDMYSLPNSGNASSAAPIDYCWACNQVHISITQPASTTICSGSSLQLSAVGASNLNWMPGNITGSSITVSPTATTIYSVKNTDALGCTKIASQLITVNTAVPAIPSAISGNAVVCANTTNISYSVTTVTGNAYNWTPPAGVTIVSGQGTNRIVCDFGSSWLSGNLSVTAVNGCGNSAVRLLGLKSKLAAPATLTGNSYQCANTSATFSITAVAGATSYTWGITGDATISGSGTNATVVTGPTFTTGVLSVTANNNCGAGVAKTLALKSIVAMPVSIAGNVYQCANTSSTFSCTAVSGASGYTWSVNGDATLASATNTAQVLFGSTFSTSTVSVTAYNSCGSSPAKTLAVKNFVTAPSLLSGPTAGLCPSGISSATYTATAVAGAVSYIWTLPSGAIGTSFTNTITVTFSAAFTAGNLSVSAVSVCGIVSAAKVLALKSVLASPTAITGNISGLCSASGVSYSCTSVAGATGYIWSVPSGSNISSGQGTTNITVNFSAFVTGNITVSATNLCGNSISKVLAVKGAPATPGIITGVTGICVNQAGVVFSIAPVANTTLYTWTVPVGATIVSGQTSTSIVVNFGAMGGNIAVKASNTCGLSIVRTLLTTITCITTINSNYHKSLLNPNEQETGFFLFPNPAHNEFALSINADGINEVIIEVYDMLGNKVIQKKQIITSGENIFYTSIENYKKGIYFVRIIDATTNTLFAKKIIKD